VILEERDGNVIVSGPVAGTSAGVATFLAPVSPNPVLRGSVFRYSVGADLTPHGPVEVSLALYDTQGRKVRVLRNGRDGAGEYLLTWDGADQGGIPVPAGVYFARFRAGPWTQVSRVSVVR